MYLFILLLFLPLFIFFFGGGGRGEGKINIKDEIQDMLAYNYFFCIHDQLRARRALML